MKEKREQTLRRGSGQGKKNRVVSGSEAETLRIAGEFARSLRGGEAVLLEGELGAGKTTFVRGMARAFGIREPIRSPTFTLMHVHLVKGQRSKVKRFVHIDAYRLRGAADLRAIGISEYLGKRDTVTVIEWGRKARKLVSSGAIRISIAMNARTLLRNITMTSV